jgi:aldose 1-epimerase
VLKARISLCSHLLLAGCAARAAAPIAAPSAAGPAAASPAAVSPQGAPPAAVAAEVKAMHPSSPSSPSSPASASAPPPTPPSGSIVQTPFGKADGKNVDLYTLTNGNGVVLKVMTYGAAVTALLVPDRRGKLADVVLGFDDLDGYVKSNPFFGVTVGRVANRIRDAKFSLDGKVFKLAANDKHDHLHGGVKGWDKAIWEAEALQAPEGPSLRLRHRSPDGDEGYPGTVSAEVIYTLTNTNQLRIAMQATTDKTTLVNMAHHSYFNLGGESAGLITEHQLALHADKYTPGAPLVPTGQVKPVKGTAFDFTTSKPIGRDLAGAGGDPVGFDHNFVVDGPPQAMRPVARLEDPKSGRVMTVAADQPGVQFYTGNFLDGKVLGKGGRPYPQHSGLCLETQRFPNAINVPAWRNQVILHPGETYSHHMVFAFTTK